MPRLLVVAKYVLTLDQKNPLIEDGAILVEGNRISAVGQRKALDKPGTYDERIGSDGDIALPGLVNSHFHAGRAFRSFAPDLPIELGFINLREGTRPRLSDEDLYWNVAYSAVECIKRGITTVLDHHPGLAKSHFVSADAVVPALKAYEETGMRVSLAYGVTNQNRYAYQPDEEFIKRLPDDLAKEAAGRIKPFSVDDYYRNWLSVYEAFNGRHDRIKVMFGPMNIHWCTDDLLQWIKGKAREHRTGIHTHLSETPYQLLYAQKTWGKGVTPYDHLLDIGFLGPEVSLGHAVWSKERDWKIAGDTGTTVVSCMASNLRMGNGIFPLLGYLDYGAKVAFGTDGRGLNDDNDILQDLRLFMFSQRLHGIDAPRISGQRILELCIRNGARATLWDDQIGVLEPGRQADVILMSSRRAFQTPYVSKDHHPAEVIMHRASGHDVTASVIGGKVVMKDGRMVSIDEDRLQAKILEMWERYQAAVQGDRAFAVQLIPHVEKFFKEWDRDIDRSMSYNYRYNIR
jgi:5-methylthioadenosine/S-adenosylhomocysteine deaminase